jgi:hypothetical protein
MASTDPTMLLADMLDKFGTDNSGPVNMRITSMRSTSHFPMNGPASQPGARRRERFG